MIGAPNTQGQKYWVDIVQWAPETSVPEELADIFRNYNIDNIVYMEGYMLCWTFVNSVISFKSFYIRRVFHKIRQIIPKFATQI